MMKKLLQKIKEYKVAIIAISVISVAVLVAGIIFWLSTNKNTVITIQSKKALPGETVQIDVTIDKNDGLYYGLMVLDYDYSALEYITYSGGEVFTYIETAEDTNGRLCILVNEEAENTTKNGTIVTLEFKVRETASKGDHYIRAYLPEKVEDGTYFVKSEDVKKEKWTIPEFVDGKITVK